MTHPAWGSATLYRGAEQLGSVATVSGSSSSPNKGQTDCVCLEDVGALLGFRASRSGDELLLSRSDTNLRVILNAGVAWRDIYLVSLKGTPFEQGGRCWLDTASAISLFQHAAGNGSQNRLRFAVSGQSVQTPPVVTPTATVATKPAASPSVSSESNIGFIEIPEPTPIATTTVSTVSTPTQAAPVATSTPVNTPKPSNSATPIVTPKNARPQPKYETFRSDVPQQKTVYPSLNSGTVQRVRWSTSGGKVRAVIDVSDGADPVVQFKDGALHALFSSTPQSLEGLPSPYDNIKVSMSTVTKSNAGVGTELVFTSRANRIEKMVLNSPRRIVFDFFFPSGTRILAAQNTGTSPQTSVSLPIPTGSAMPATPTKSPSPSVTPSPAKSQPPATPTPAPVVNIPRQSGKRKLVVVDPGHGGKDPGTSGNGVIEKNINLSIGLELEKILKSKGFDVIMTRRTDVYLQLQERADIANNANADVFVSVHVNALPSSKTASGFEIYIMALPTDKDAMNLAKIENREYVEGHSSGNEASDRRTEMLLQILGDMQQNNKISESTDLAEVLFVAGKQNGIPMRRVAQAPFFVLRGAAMPAVLLETGFVTNASEAKLLAHAPYQQRIAQAMATGIANYLK